MKKVIIPACFLAAALGVTANAQDRDNTVTTKTQVKADDARTVHLKGCLVQTPGTGLFVLNDAVAVTGGDLTTESRVKTDVDNDKTKVEMKSTVKVDDDDRKTVGTAGAMKVYELSAASGVNLAQYVGKQVQVSAVMVDAGKGTANVKMETTTKVDNDDAPDTKEKVTTKAEIPQGPRPRLTALSVTGSTQSCQ